MSAPARGNPPLRQSLPIKHRARARTDINQRVQRSGRFVVGLSIVIGTCGLSWQIVLFLCLMESGEGGEGGQLSNVELFPV
jgi:hypothetical protein